MIDYRGKCGFGWNEEMTQENFFKVQQKFPYFWFLTESEKSSLVEDFKNIKNKEKNNKKLSVYERSKLIFANIFGNFNQKIDLDKAEADSILLCFEIDKNKPEQFEDKDMYNSWVSDWQMANVLLATVYAYKNEYLKSAYHFLVCGIFDRYLGDLTLKRPYYEFICYILNKVNDLKPQKAKYCGCGFNPDNPIGAYDQKKNINLISYDALCSIPRMIGKNGEVIVATDDESKANSVAGCLTYINSVCSNKTNTGKIKKYKTLIIDKEYNLLEVELYYDPNFEELEIKNYVGYVNKNNFKVADGFTIRGTALKDYMIRYVNSNGSLIDEYKKYKYLI